MSRVCIYSDKKVTYGCYTQETPDIPRVRRIISQLWENTRSTGVGVAGQQKLWLNILDSKRNLSDVARAASDRSSGSAA